MTFSEKKKLLFHKTNRTLLEVNFHWMILILKFTNRTPIPMFVHFCHNTFANCSFFFSFCFWWWYLNYASRIVNVGIVCWFFLFSPCLFVFVCVCVSVWVCVFLNFISFFDCIISFKDYFCKNKGFFVHVLGWLFICIRSNPLNGRFNGILKPFVSHNHKKMSMNELVMVLCLCVSHTHTHYVWFKAFVKMWKKNDSAEYGFFKSCVVFLYPIQK